MKITYFLLGVFVVLYSANGDSLLRERRAVDFVTGKCDSTQTMIYTRTIHTTNFTKCPISTLVSRYFEPFLDECQHWMGRKPDHVASSDVYYCLEDPTTGGVIIKATVCCKGTLPPNRCVTCTSTDPEQCDYSTGAVVTCAPDEVCQTRLSCEDNALQATIHKSCVKTCFSPKSCLVNSYLEFGEQCADCCNTALCNKGGRALSCYGKCRCDNMVPGNYHCDSSGRCVCNAGCSGKRCETCKATCNPNPCKNSGICKQTGSSVSCCCKPGYGGEYCEKRLLSCDRSLCSDHGECTENEGKTQCICDPGYFGETCQKISAEFNCPNAKNVYFTNPAPFESKCYRVVQTQLSKTSELSACRYYMRSQYNSRELFQDGKNGHVTEVTDVGYNFCQDGDCGYVHYQTKTCCPSCFSNPCQNGGYCLQTEQRGTEEDYVCRCKFGFTGKYCEKRVQTCFAFGEPHYITYDGKFITYQGTCRYVLTKYEGDIAGLTSFVVYVKNEHRNKVKTISYPSYIEAEVYGYHVRLARNNVVLVKSGDQEFRQVSLNAVYKNFTIKTTGRFVRLETDFGLVVQYDGYNMMFVQIPDVYKHSLTGLCNNMDGDINNDLRDCTGIVRDDNEVGHSQYGDSCLDPEYTDRSETCITTPPGSCHTELFSGNQWCGYIVDKDGPFASCVDSQSVNVFTACKYDVCRDPKSRCQALESFVEKCYRSGGSPDPNWRNVTKCPMDCPRNSHYLFSGPACQPTCDNPKAHLSCEFEDTEICQCDEGFLLKNGHCVPVSECGCKDVHNVRYEFGDIWDEDLDRCLQKKCIPCTPSKCTSPGRIITERMTPIDGEWGSWSEWSTCTNSTDQQRRVRQCNKPAPLCSGLRCVGRPVQTKACPTTTTTTTTTTITTTTTPTTTTTTTTKPPTTTTTSTEPPTTTAATTEPPTTKRPTTPPTTTTTTTERTTITTTATTTTTPSLPCLKNFDFAKACTECDRTRNPNMYVANPCGCDSYFQCFLDVSGYYRVTEIQCSFCTCWNQTKLTCDHDLLKRNTNSDKCKDEDPEEEHVTDNGDYCTVKAEGSKYVRRFREIPGDNTHYIDIDGGEVKMPCAPGTIFNSKECACVIGGNNKRQREFLCLDFNNKNNPYASSTGYWISASGIGLYSGEPGVEGYGLRFDGGNIEVPAFNNKEIHQITISLWYKRDRPSYKGVGALISNDDCTNNQKPSIQILSKSAHRVGGGIRTQSSNVLSALFTNVADDRRWHHVALTYDTVKKMASFYLDGKLKKTKLTQGAINGAHCPLLIGSMYNGNFFHGMMDQICFYDNALTARQVKNLYEEYLPNVPGNL